LSFWPVCWPDIYCLTIVKLLTSPLVYGPHQPSCHRSQSPFPGRQSLSRPHLAFTAIGRSRLRTKTRRKNKPWRKSAVRQPGSYGRHRFSREIMRAHCLEQHRICCMPARSRLKTLSSLTRSMEPRRRGSTSPDQPASQTPERSYSRRLDWPMGSVSSSASMGGCCDSLRQNSSSRPNFEPGIDVVIAFIIWKGAWASRRASRPWQ
jgi:hypothetical protein